jgi:hypothetical protein
MCVRSVQNVVCLCIVCSVCLCRVCLCVCVQEVSIAANTVDLNWSVCARVCSVCVLCVCVCSVCVYMCMYA